MKIFLASLVALSLFLFSFYPGLRDEQFIKENIHHADAQMKNMLQEVASYRDRFPRTIDSSGRIISTDAYDWTSGFFPGNLWYLYEFTGDAKYRSSAIKWTEKLEAVKNYTAHHDLGFIMYCSYGNAYRLTGDARYKDVLIQTAKSLSTRYDSITKSIKSWDRFQSWHGNKVYDFPVIIDNMMNLELLFFASKVTGDPRYKNIAITHANTTLKNQLRKDKSIYHVVCYDQATGAVIGKETAQGLADRSTWSRGQAWGIYGFTTCYRETGDIRYLKTAQHMADFYIKHKRLPSDKVPYWDFNLGQKGYVPGVLSHATKDQNKYRDASAAAITASALLELSQYLGSKGESYRKVAIQILHSLSGPSYRAPLGGNGNFLLMHSVGSVPHQMEVDKPLVYADYYYLEALYRYNKLLSGKMLFAKNN